MTSEPAAAASLDDDGFPLREKTGAEIVRAAPRVLWRLTKLGLQSPWRLLIAVLSVLASSVFGLVIPKLLGAGVDQASVMLHQGAAHAGEVRLVLLRIGALILGAGLLRGLFLALNGYESEYVSQTVAAKLRLAYFAQLQRLSFDYHDRIHSGDLITRGMIDLEGARNFIDMGLLRVVMLVSMLAVGIWLLLSADLGMGLIALSFAPFVGFNAVYLGRRLRRTWLQRQELMSVLTRTMEENLQGIRVVRAFAARAFELGKFDRDAGVLLALENRRITMRTGGMASMTVAYYASLGLLLWVGGHRVADGRMTVGRLTEFLAYMTLLLQPVRMIGMVTNAWARAASCGGRLFDILDMEPRIQDAPGAHALVLSEGVLRFEHVDFGYRPGATVLHDISFEVRPGRTLGIVGPPGAGKSTIAHLIPRFYDVDAGRITIDGQDIRDVTLASLRQTVGVVQQESFLFDASVTNNVAYADPWAEEDRIVEATTTAHIHDYVASLSEGYEAKLGERGVSLSGGQRQRMSIARGVVPGPGVMIFDDATAAIDAATEQQVRRSLQAATQTKAVIIVAHRLGSLMHADEIIVLDEGRIVERGAHADLIAAGGRYAAIYRLQTRTGDVVAPAGEASAEALA